MGMEYDDVREFSDGDGVLNRIDVDGRMRELSNVGISLPEPEGVWLERGKWLLFARGCFPLRPRLERTDHGERRTAE
jgi:hypothetical protein